MLAALNDISREVVAEMADKTQMRIGIICAWKTVPMASRCTLTLVADVVIEHHHERNIWRGCHARPARFHSGISLTTKRSTPPYMAILEISEELNQNYSLHSNVQIEVPTLLADKKHVSYATSDPQWQVCLLNHIKTITQSHGITTTIFAPPSFTTITTGLLCQ
jgi:hypothetical protein